MAKAEIRLGECGIGARTYYRFAQAVPSDGVINCGFKPKQILVVKDNYYNSGNPEILWVDTDSSPNTQHYYYNHTKYDVPIDGTTRQIKEITDTGFVMGYPSYYQASDVFVMAIG